MACSEELVGCSQKECQPLEVKAPPSKSGNSPHMDACVTPLWNKRHSTPAEEMLMECTESALQYIEYGPLPEVQRCMLVLSAMLTGASVDHGRRPILVSLSTFSAAADTEILNFSAAADTKKLKNGMDNNNLAATIKELQASDLRLDSNLAESCSMESKGSQKAAAHPAFSPFVPVVSRSVHLRCVKRGFFSIY